MNSAGPPATWSPSLVSARSSSMDSFRRSAESVAGAQLADSTVLHRWSVENPVEFWSHVWDYFSVVGDRASSTWTPGVLPEATYFPGSRVNLAENLLAPWRGSDRPAVVWVGEGEGTIETRELIGGEDLRRRVGSFAQALRAHGVGTGDRIGLIMPVGPQALVCTLAALCVGAVVSSVSPEFGAPSIVDRLGQLEPVALVAALSYRWNGKDFHRAGNVADVLKSLPTLKVVFTTGDDHTGEISSSRPSGCSQVRLADALADDVEPVFENVSFDHPAYVLFSSGTTGKPKCLIHRGGGVLLKHLVELGLHADVKEGDRLLYYTTTSWMMWNWGISCLALGATLVLHDGAPSYPDALALFDAAAMSRATHLGLSARLLDHIKSQAGAVSSHTGPCLRQVLVTGSPLSVTTAEWLAEQVGPRVMINPISGGTDLVGCFVGGDPTRPFRAGEMTGPLLGMAVDVFTDEGISAKVNEPGELVCLKPFPTVPVGIWADPDGERLRSTYFDMWPGVWVHGDRAMRAETGGITILGRSDATLNVGGVRIGTAEIYAAVADHPAVADSLAFGQEWEGDIRIVLLVVPNPGVEINDEARSTIRSAIRHSCSPRHVPALVVAVPDLPRTQTGKLSEVAVREAVAGREVKGLGALANPAVLEIIAAKVAMAQQI